MSRYIDADEFLEDESEAYMEAQLKLKADADRETYMANMITHMKIRMLIADAPTEDVVSMEQYNKLYEEKLELEKINEHLRCVNSNLLDSAREAAEYD